MKHHWSVEVLPRMAQLVGERQGKSDPRRPGPRGIEIDKQLASVYRLDDVRRKVLIRDRTAAYGASVNIALAGRVFFPRRRNVLPALLPVFVQLRARSIGADGVHRAIKKKRSS